MPEIAEFLEICPKSLEERLDENFPTNQRIETSALQIECNIIGMAVGRPINTIYSLLVGTKFSLKTGNKLMFCP